MPPDDTLARRLSIDRVDGAADEFISRDGTDERHVFGGLLVGQALRAARLTVEPFRAAHSLHASFVRRGHGGGRLHHTVERTRDGISFGTRRVVARQGGEVLMVMTADFHDEQEGLEYEAPPTTGVPRPEELPPSPVQSRVFEGLDVPASLVPGSMPLARRTWFRTRVPIDPAASAEHLEALAYLSDHGPSRAARAPHSSVPREAIDRPVSLDHSLWFHRPVCVNDWLLYELIPVATGRGRGLSMGTIRDGEGTLLATVAQEIRLRPKGAVADPFDD